MNKNVDGVVIIGTELDTSGLEEGLDDIKDEYDDETLDLNTEGTEKGLKRILGLTKKIGNGFLRATGTTAKFALNITKTVAELGAIGALLGVLALVGIGIANAFKQAIQKDEELQAKVEYLKFAVTNAFVGIGEQLVGVFNWLIDRLYDILGILGGIIELITGVNIFAKATADNFKNANKSAGQLKKTLAGFDEMNILNDNGTVGIGGNLANIFGGRDLSTEVDSWKQKVKDWFLGEGNDTFGEAIQSFFRDAPSLYKEYLWNPIKTVFFDPLFENFDLIIKQAEPAWRPFVEKGQEAINDIKTKFEPLVTWLNDNIFKKVEAEFTTTKNQILQILAPFLNTIIYWINQTFGVFGIKLDYIDDKTAQSRGEWEDNMVSPLKETEDTLYDITKGKFDVNVKTDKVKTVSGFVDNIWGRLKDITSRVWNVTVNSLFGERQATQKHAKGGIYYPSLPRLAVGGIVSQPGRGIPYHNAIIGEKGAEGILPLTDSQQMALLGEAIGRYVNINATVPVYVGNRMVAREIKRINAEDDFAFNR